MNIFQRSLARLPHVELIWQPVVRILYTWKSIKWFNIKSFIHMWEILSTVVKDIQSVTKNIFYKDLNPVLIINLASFFSFYPIFLASVNFSFEKSSKMVKRNCKKINLAKWWTHYSIKYIGDRLELKNWVIIQQIFFLSQSAIQATPVAIYQVQKNQFKIDMIVNRRVLPHTGL